MVMYPASGALEEKKVAEQQAKNKAALPKVDLQRSVTTIGMDEARRTRPSVIQLSLWLDTPSDSEEYESLVEHCLKSLMR